MHGNAADVRDLGAHEREGLACGHRFGPTHGGAVEWLGAGRGRMSEAEEAIGAEGGGGCVGA